MTVDQELSLKEADIASLEPVIRLSAACNWNAITPQKTNWTLTAAWQTVVLIRLSVGCSCYAITPQNTQSRH